MKALIVEDEPLIARDLAEIIEDFFTHIEIVHNYEQAIVSLSQHNFDFCFCDVNLNTHKTGIDIALKAKVKNPNLQLIYITSYTDSDTIKKIGITQPLNLISKPYTPSQVKASVNLAIVNKNNKTEVTKTNDKLTKKQLDILKLISENKTSRDIAEMMSLSEKTIRNHRYNIKKKLGLSPDKNSLLLYALAYFKK